jgi:hypothetical protein
MAAQGALYQWNLPLAQKLGIPLIKGIATNVLAFMLWQFGDPEFQPAKPKS